MDNCPRVLVAAVDEIHNGRNINTKQAKAMFSLTRAASVTVGATATPIPKTPSDIYNILFLLHHAKFRSTALRNRIDKAIRDAEAEARSNRSKDPEGFYGYVARSLTGDTSAVDSGESQYDSALMKVTKAWALEITRMAVPCMIRRSKTTTGAEGRPILNIKGHHDAVIVLNQTPSEAAVYAEIGTMEKELQEEKENSAEQKVEGDDEGEGGDGNPFRIYSRLALHHPACAMRGSDFRVPSCPEEVEFCATVKIKTLGHLLLHFLSSDDAPHVLYDGQNDVWLNACTQSRIELRRRHPSPSERLESTRKIVVYCHFPSVLPTIILVSCYASYWFHLITLLDPRPHGN
jgi:hypothetical protein